MARPKADPERMRTQILDTAERLLVAQGPKALTLRKIANQLNLSHPALLYYFKGLEGLLEALRQRAARSLRSTLLAQLEQVGRADGLGGSVQQTVEGLADPAQAALLAWLLAEGRMPFPPAEERGLKQVVDRLEAVTEHTRDALEAAVECVVLASIGEALVGNAVRVRLDSSGEQGPFSERLMAFVDAYLVERAAER
jgi:AcrR family transcriptional regulator